MGLTKREFIKAIGIVAILGSGFGILSKKLYNDYKEITKNSFNPDHEYGYAFPFIKDRRKAIKLAKKHAQTCLPPNTYYEIREKMPTDWGRDKGIAWYYKPNMKQEINILREPIFVNYTGCFYHGTFKTTMNYG